MKKVWTAVSYAGLTLANAAFSYFSGIGKKGFHEMDRYDWIMFNLTMLAQSFIVMRALANGTFANGNGSNPAK